MSDSITQKITKRIKAKGRGTLFTPKDFLDLGSRDAVDKALSRLAQQDDIRRLARGLYDYPKMHPTFGPLTPSLDDIAKVLADSLGTDLQVSGAQAANILGLSTQVPAQNVYLTNGPTRQVNIGKQKLILKHAGTKVMAGSGKLAGAILQAIRYLGPDQVTQQTANQIKKKMSSSDKMALKKLARFAPDWARPTITGMIEA